MRIILEIIYRQSPQLLLEVSIFGVVLRWLAFCAGFEDENRPQEMCRCKCEESAHGESDRAHNESQRVTSESHRAHIDLRAQKSSPPKGNPIFVLLTDRGDHPR